VGVWDWANACERAHVLKEVRKDRLVSAKLQSSEGDCRKSD